MSSAYQSSQESAKTVVAAMATVSQSRESRKGLNGLEGKIQEALEDLKTLKDELSYPDLTPTINRVPLKNNLLPKVFINQIMYICLSLF